MDWLPTLSEGSGPVYRRIVDALSNDIASGRLRRGQQLPTHRALAQALRIDLTTVTRAYGEARRRGLLDARVKVETRGGVLTIEWPGAGTNVTMTGPATSVFEGEWVVPAK